jgi:hypothetical protein
MVFSTRALSKHSQPRPWPYPRHRFRKVMFQPPKPRFQDLGSGTSRLHTWRSPVFSSSRLLLAFSFSGRSATYLFSDILSFSCITTSTYFPPAQPSTLHSLGLEHVHMEATIQVSDLALEARHMDSSMSSCLRGPENRWHMVPPHHDNMHPRKETARLPCRCS